MAERQITYINGQEIRMVWNENSLRMTTLRLLSLPGRWIQVRAVVSGQEYILRSENGVANNFNANSWGVDVRMLVHGDPWQADTVYDMAELVRPTTDNNRVYECSDPGVSGSVEPVWNTAIDSQTADGSVSWRCHEDAIDIRGPAELQEYFVETGAV